MGNYNSCLVGDPDAPPPPNCGNTPPPPPPLTNNNAVTAGQKSGSTFDTSLQRTVQMGLSPLHL